MTEQSSESRGEDAPSPSDAVLREYAPLPYQSLDPSGHIRNINQAWCDLLRYTRGDVVGRWFGEVLTTESRAQFEDRFPAFKAEGSVSDVEFDMVCEDGTEIPVSVTGTIEYDADGAVVCAHCQFQEISAQTRREAELQESRETFEDLFDGINDAVFVHDLDGRFRLVNETALERLGYSEAELLEMTIRELDAPERSPEIGEKMEALGRDGRLTFETVHLSASGERIPVEVSSSLIDVEGTRAVLSVARDISERKERAHELRRMKRAVDASGHAMYVTDPDGTIEYVNPAFEQITGYPPGEALGETPRILNSGEMPEAYFEELWDAVLAGEVWEEEVTNRRKSGELYHAHQTIAPIVTEGDGIAGFVAIQTDITERKTREAALAKRDRILRELHSTTKAFLEAESESAVLDRIAAALSNALELSRFAVLWYDQASGRLEMARTSDEFPERYGDGGAVSPGDNPVWNAFHGARSRLVREVDTGTLGPEWPDGTADLLAVPIQGHGVLLVTPSAAETIEGVDVDLIELLAGNAEAMLSRLAGESQVEDLSRTLTSTESRVDALEGLIEAIEGVQQRLGSFDARQPLAAAVCEELVETEIVDFAWIGYSETSDAHLVPSAWAGRDGGFLDAVSLDPDSAQLPAQRAATGRRPVSIARIAAHAASESWAGDALSREFNAVLSVPLLHDEILYGVLTLYSGTESAFDRPTQVLFEGVGTLVANYLSILYIRHADSGGGHLEIEFAIEDSNYPLHVLGTAAGARIEFETVLETLASSIRILVTVPEGSPREVIEAAGELPSVRTAEFFGEPRDNQLILTLKKPFLGSEVVQHGGRLVGSVAGPTETRARIAVPTGISVRPLAESLKSQYPDIELIARRQRTGARTESIARPSSYLTERQYEILKAAFYGGYYESPRGITGEDLAHSFEISNTVVHDHLKAAHRRILARVFDSESDNRGLNN